MFADGNLLKGYLPHSVGWFSILYAVASVGLGAMSVDEAVNYVLGGFGLIGIRRALHK